MAIIRSLRGLAARFDRFTRQELNAPLTHHLLAGR